MPFRPPSPAAIADAVLGLPQRRSRRAKVGLPPGTVLFIGEAPPHQVTIAAIDYTAEALDEPTIARANDIQDYRQSKTVTWLNVDGVHDTELLKALGTELGIHDLALEDIASLDQRPKIEDHQDFLYLVVRMVHIDDAGVLHNEQLSLILDRYGVVSFQERPGDVFGGVRERLRQGRARIRRSGPDFLAYALIDTIVDHYLLTVEQLDEQLDAMEVETIERRRGGLVPALHQARRDVVAVRRAAWPLRELVATLSQSESPLVSKELHRFLRDVHDHLAVVLDTLETQRDRIASLVDLDLSLASTEMNEVMKVLTIIATIFIPLTFIAGIYGMNFAYMPELGWRWGYPAVMGGMSALGLGLVWFFKRRNWF